MSRPPVDPRALMAEAVTLHRAGRLEAAIAKYRDLVGRQPRLAEAHHNLGVALRAAGRAEEAAASYRRALKARPDYPQAHTALATLLEAAGNVQAALHHRLAARRLAPGDDEAKRRLWETLRGIAFTRPAPDVARALAGLFAEPDLDLQPLVRPALSLLRLAPPVADALRLAEAGDAAGLARLAATPGFRRALADPLATGVLTRAVAAADDIEALLAALRRLWLEAALDGRLAEADRPLLAAVAAQCRITEWAWPESAAEAAAVARLAAGLDPARPDAALMAYAQWRPLEPLVGEGAEALLAAATSENERLVLRRHLLEPAEERAIAKALPRLAQSGDPVSAAVKAMYEESPYPRWPSVALPPPAPLPAVLAERYAAYRRPPGQAFAPLRVLVAGCGTGRHALGTARRWVGADVLALDLSRASLAYAAREATARGVANIRFAEADILGLAGRPERFDLVECSGVLHHMADPMAGWRALRGLLAPGGVMRLALYSRKGRVGIDSGRAEIARLGLAATPDGIRAARAALRALPDGDPARALTRTADFYSLSGCRDMLFHVQELRYDLPEIARALGELELRFLGFELYGEGVARAFRARFPTGALDDLALWDAFETENPTVFAAMYQFWCQAA